jgi:dTDP-glucose 4,6-dehydratase
VPAATPSILVTGGSGFIGSNFIRYWRRAHPGEPVVNLDALTYAANPRTLEDIDGQPGYRFVRGDIADPAAVEAAMRGCDRVIHFAAESHVDRSIRAAAPFLRTNVVGTQVLLDAARRLNVRRFHHVSTDEVFGHLGLRDSARFNESTPYAPRSPYAASKAASDHLVRAYHHTYGLPVTITNGCNNHGPYQFPEKAIPRFATRLLQGQSMPVYGKGENRREWLHVEDYCRAIDLVLSRGRVGETYLVGSGEERSTREVAEAVARALGAGPDRIEYVADRPGHDLRYAIDSTKIRTELGWRPMIGFDEGIANTVQWYQDHTDWWKPLIAAAEALP